MREALEKKNFVLKDDVYNNSTLTILRFVTFLVETFRRGLRKLKVDAFADLS